MKAASQSITLTLFRDAAASSKVERVFRLPVLADIIRARTAPQKSMLPWLKAAQFGEQRTAKGSLRHDANLLAISGIEADYDGERMPFDAACELLERQGIASVVYTSPSHTEDAPRWRVLCPLSEEMPPARRDHQLGRLNGLFRGIFSTESWTLSQAYYFGSINQNPSHRVELIEGLPIDAHDDLDEIWRGKPGASKNTDGANQLGTHEDREDAELVRCIATGDHWHVELCALAARYIGRDIPATTVEGLLRGMMLAHPEVVRDERWLDRFNSIDALVASAVRKYQRIDKKRPDPRRKAIARATFHMLRQRTPAIELLPQLHLLNQEQTEPLPDDVVNSTAIWCTRRFVGARDAG